MASIRTSTTTATLSVQPLRVAPILLQQLAYDWLSTQDDSLWMV
jgi:hypothetical protein